MTTRFSLLLLTCLTAACFAARAADTGDRRVALFEDARHKQWCARSQSKAAIAEIRKVGALEVGTLFYTDGRLSKIDYDVENESGDFSVTDDYFLDNDGTIERFEQRTSTFDGNAIALESYTVRDGVFHKFGTRYFDLKTRKPISEPKDMFPGPGSKFHKSLNTLPFFALMQNPAILTGKKICAPEH